MKYLYVCEKCGKQFGDFELAKQCEESHLDIDASFHEFQHEMDVYKKWAEGGLMPTEIVLATQCENGTPIDDDDYPTCHFGVYQFTRNLKESEIRKIVFGFKKRKEEEAEWTRKYNERKANAGA